MLVYYSYSINNKKAQLSLGWTDRTVYIRRPASDFYSRGKKAISQSDCSPIGEAATSTLQSTPVNDTII